MIAITIAVVTATPMAKASRYNGHLVIRGNTKMPPWGALSSQPNSMERPPATAEPIIWAGMTRSGSAEANGIAPSVMNDSPRIHAASPWRFSASENFLGRSRDARLTATGGTMPPTIIAAIGA